jgi:hypothetical protein
MEKLHGSMQERLERLEKQPSTKVGAETYHNLHN